MKIYLKLITLVAVCLLTANVFAQVSKAELRERVALLKAGDELRFDDVVISAMQHKDATFRKEAVMTAGRIGDEDAIPHLEKALTDESWEVRQTSMFALGEIESVKAAKSILGVLSNPKAEQALVNRAIEAAGKIIAANPESEESKSLKPVLLETVKRGHENKEEDELRSVLSLTALLRAKPDGAAELAAKFLDSESDRVRADAANTLARLRSDVANKQLQQLLFEDSSPIVRANAARVLGATDAPGFAVLLLKAALTDKDSRVRTNAIAALGASKSKKYGSALVFQAEQALSEHQNNKKNGGLRNELLYLSTAIGRLLSGTDDIKAVTTLDKIASLFDEEAAEVEVALVRVSPASFLKRIESESESWRQRAAFANALGESAEMEDGNGVKELKTAAEEALQSYLQAVWDGNEKSDLSFPSVLSAYAKFKPSDLDSHLRRALLIDDVATRASAASLLAERIPATDKPANFYALVDAFGNAEKDILNDAHLATLDAISKQIVELRKDDSLKVDLIAPVRRAAAMPDYLVRRKAFEIAKELNIDLKGVAMKSFYGGKGNTRLRKPDYEKALQREKASVRLETDLGSFDIMFYPREAPLTVENFLKLVRDGYFDGLEIHRVVPNFVVQDGDPRGDGNGGPGWAIRCEINELQYRRGTVGMALAGKDTGGSQWFVAHSPQPHLDGGYTVFGRVNETGMNIVDMLAKGDVIRKVTVIEEKFESDR